MSQENSKDRYAQFLSTSHLFGANAPFIEALYGRFLDDPTLVEPHWREFFEQLQSGGGGADVDHDAIKARFEALARQPCRVAGQAAQPAIDASKQVAVLQLINAYRVRGHQQANLDPLGLQEQAPIAELDPTFHALTEADM